MPLEPVPPVLCKEIYTQPFGHNPTTTPKTLKQERHQRVCPPVFSFQNKDVCMGAAIVGRSLKVFKNEGSFMLTSTCLAAHFHTFILQGR